MRHVDSAMTPETAAEDLAGNEHIFSTVREMLRHRMTLAKQPKAVA
jgi:hypothetical protein